MITLIHYTSGWNFGSNDKLAATLSAIILKFQTRNTCSPVLHSEQGAVRLSVRRWTHAGAGWRRAFSRRKDAGWAAYRRLPQSPFDMFNKRINPQTVWLVFNREDVDRHGCGARIWDQRGGTVVRQAGPWTWYNFLSVFVSEPYRITSLSFIVLTAKSNNYGI